MKHDGQSEYIQTFSNPAINILDSNLLMTSIVPLTITFSENQTKHIWKDSRPSSTRYCKALQFKFVKKTLNLIREERICVKNKIKHLYETEVNLHG